MADAMVTGRMSPAKKEAGNRILEELGTNASQAINQLYDFLIEERALPFASATRAPVDASRISEARAFVGSLQRANAFSVLTDAEIKQRKIARHGIVFGDDA